MSRHAIQKEELVRAEPQGPQHERIRLLEPPSDEVAEVVVELAAGVEPDDWACLTLGFDLGAGPDPLYDFEEIRCLRVGEGPWASPGSPALAIQVEVRRPKLPLR